MIDTKKQIMVNKNYMKQFYDMEIKNTHVQSVISKFLIKVHTHIIDPLSILKTLTFKTY